LKFISEEGMRCTDALIPYKEIKKDLNNSERELYLLLFRGNKFKEKF
jgi:hypothetical protein